LRAGGGEPGYSVEQFLPDKVTVLTGTTVTWVNNFEEPHTVTFGNPQGDPTTAINVGAQPVQYDGTQSFSSGLFAPGYPPGPPGTPAGPTSFAVTFTKAGNFNYFCAIHPNMKGEVDVVDSGAVDTQAEIDAAGDAAYAAALASLKADNGQQQTNAKVTTNADGTKTYTVDVGGNDNPYGSLMQFYPPSVDVATGDTVTWETVTHTPHTVTFHPEMFQGDPFGPPAIPQGAYDGSSLANSGIIQADTPATSFSLKFSKAGSYQYVCLLHATEGMVGKVNVSAASNASPTPGKTSTGGAPKPPNTGSGTTSSSGNSLWIGLGVLASLFILSGAGVAAVKRHN
jgi:plastocyanin